MVRVTPCLKTRHLENYLESNKLNIPDPRVLPSDARLLSTPFVHVGDEAFALSEHVLRPYPNKNLTFLKRIYNYRLSKEHER